MAEHSTLWCIAIFYRDEVLDYQKTNQEEDPKSKDNLEIRKHCVSVFSEKVIKFLCCCVMELLLKPFCIDDFCMLAHNLIMNMLNHSHTILLYLH